MGKPLKKYQNTIAESLQEIEQSIKDWTALMEYFPNKIYQNVEGLCKIADLAEIKAQDYSLTPGRYVGVSVEIDMDFDYKSRMTKIHTELAKLNTEANDLMAMIQNSGI